jgi:hypothetical protein
MTVASSESSIIKAKVMAVKETIKEFRPHAIDIEVTVETRTFSWKPPSGFGWSRTNDPRVAIHNATRRIHVVTSPGTGDLYYYK